MTDDCEIAGTFFLGYPVLLTFFKPPPNWFNIINTEDTYVKVFHSDRVIQLTESLYTFTMFRYENRWVVVLFLDPL